MSSLRRWPISSIIILGILVFMGVFAPIIAPYGASDMVLENRHVPPVFFGGSWDHILGTDPLGRDILSRLIYGARISLFVSAVALISGGVIGTVIGLVSGYAGVQRMKC